MAGASGLPLAGVEAIVEGLSSFQGDIRKMNSSLDSIRPQSTLLQNAISGAWEMMGNFGREILNVAEVALGKILGDAIEWVVTKIGELISATIDAGSEFQTLELRLQRLNFNTLIQSGEEYNAAQEKSIQLTKDQLEWLQKLSASTPYDNTDISNTYTLARSYGFFDTEARKLTEDITDFVSGMGLTNVEITRIMKNFGQMRGLGKVMQRDLNDLATGGFVPVNDILERVSKNTGIAMDEMDDFRKTGESVDAFMLAFSQIVEERFAGASEKMAQTFKAASDNAMDVVKSIGGLQVVKPILDAVGARIAAFVSSFTDNPERWDRMVSAAQRVGEELSKIVGGLFDLLPSSESLADSTVLAIEGIADWLAERGPGIKTFFKDLGDIVGGVIDRIGIALSLGKKKTEKPAGNSWDFMPGGSMAGQDQKEVPFGEGILDAIQKIADFINNTLIPAFVKIQVWTEVNGPLIEEFFGTVWEIIGEVFSDITSQPGKGEGGGGILDLITKFMQFVIDNKDEITKWVEILWSVFVVWQVISTVFSIVVGIAITLITTLLGLWSVVVGLPTAFALVGIAATIVAGLLFLVIDPIIGLVKAIDNVKVALSEFSQDWTTRWEDIKTAVANKDWFGLGVLVLDGIKNGVGSLIEILINILTISFPAIIRDDIRSFDWMAVGKSIVDGLIAGLTPIGLIDAIRNLILQTESGARDAAEAHSPSRLFERVGKDIVSGMIAGITNGISGLISAARNAALSAYNAAMNVLKAHSPSLLFMELGEFTMEGFAQGIEKAAGLAASAMQNAVGQVAVPAVSSMAAARASGDTITNNRNMNLTVNSSASTESVLQDFNMMESLVGT